MSKMLPILAMGNFQARQDRRAREYSSGWLALHVGEKKKRKTDF